ncbi:hypothetical protein PG984_002714 [Apiospora sp. TS-2023a]
MDRYPLESAPPHAAAVSSAGAAFNPPSLLPETSNSSATTTTTTTSTEPTFHPPPPPPAQNAPMSVASTPATDSRAPSATVPAACLGCVSSVQTGASRC